MLFSKNQFFVFRMLQCHKLVMQTMLTLTAYFQHQLMIFTMILLLIQYPHQNNLNIPLLIPHQFQTLYPRLIATFPLLSLLTHQFLHHLLISESPLEAKVLLHGSRILFVCHRLQGSPQPPLLPLHPQKYHLPLLTVLMLIPTPIRPYPLFSPYDLNHP